MSAISFEDLSKNYGSLRALDHINLEIQEGEFFGLLGPNGAGKTTLISILAGLCKPTTGVAKVMGHDVQKDFRAARRLLGIVPQELVFDPFFNVREALEFQSGYFGIKNNSDWIDEIMHNLGLSDKADKNMRALSGGMKRRVLVAQALVHRPPVIVLDEPTASIDVKGQREIYELLKELNKSICIVVVSHDISVLLNYAKNVAHINKNLVYHSLENIEKNINTQNEHLCEVELLSALGKSHVCCEHTH